MMMLGACPSDQAWLTFKKRFLSRNFLYVLVLDEHGTKIYHFPCNHWSQAKLNLLSAWVGDFAKSCLSTTFFPPCVVQFMENNNSCILLWNCLNFWYVTNVLFTTVFCTLFFKILTISCHKICHFFTQPYWILSFWVGILLKKIKIIKKSSKNQT